jgi:hypothetical protein
MKAESQFAFVVTARFAFASHHSRMLTARSSTIATVIPRLPPSS